VIACLACGSVSNQCSFRRSSPKLAVEALNVAVLHWAARLDQDMANPVRLRPRHEKAAGEFGSFVGPHRARMPAKQGRPIQQPGHILAADAVVRIAEGILP